METAQGCNHFSPPLEGSLDQDSSNYTDLSKSIAFVHATILTSINNGIIPSLRVGENGEPILCRFEEELSFLNKNFKKVYANFEYTELGYNSFTELYYTASLGVVGLQGRDGMKWVLKEYKN